MPKVSSKPAVSKLEKVAPFSELVTGFIFILNEV